MIQRIQTLFLILALACMAMFYFFPFGNITTAYEEIVPIGVLGCDYTNEKGDIQHFSTLFLLILISISVITTLISIFLYKKRMLQIRFNVFNIVLQLGSIGMVFFYLIQAKREFGVDYSTGFLIVLPLAAAILTFLAIRAIARDEALIRSIDRLR